MIPTNSALESAKAFFKFIYLFIFLEGGTGGIKKNQRRGGGRRCCVGGGERRGRRRGEKREEEGREEGGRRHVGGGKGKRRMTLLSSYIWLLCGCSCLVCEESLPNPAPSWDCSHQGKSWWSEMLRRTGWSEASWEFYQPVSLRVYVYVYVSVGYE